MRRIYPLLLVLALIGCTDDAPPPSSPPGAGGSGGSAPPQPGGAAGGATAGTGATGGTSGTGPATRDAGSSPDTVAGRSVDAARPDLASASSGGGPRDAGTAGDGGLSSSRQTARRLGTTAAPQGFHEYLPPGYGDGTRRPLLIFMHGAGENGNGGTNLDRVLAHGPPKLIRQNMWPASRPFIVLSPQASGGCPSAASVNAFLTFALASYDVDESRIYLTGLSCGAIGTFNYLGQFRGARVAAVAVIAGDGRGAFRTAGCALGEVGIWAFHGEADSTVPPAGSTETIASLMSCPSPPRKEVKLDTYPGVGHDSWTRTYDLSAGHDIYTWLLGFTR
jgi:predicted esterase